MAVTLQARRTWGDQFTATDTLEVKFDYTELGKMGSCLTTIEKVSGVDVTHGGGASAGDYLHYKAVEEDGDSDGWIDYSTQTVQVQQAEKGDSVIKVKIKYKTKTEEEAYRAEYQTWSDTYQTEKVMESGGTEIITETGAPAPPVYTMTDLATGNISIKWADDTFV
jgi:hypothetical protein